MLLLLSVVALSSLLLITLQKIIGPLLLPVLGFPFAQLSKPVQQFESLTQAEADYAPDKARSIILRVRWE